MRKILIALIVLSAMSCHKKNSESDKDSKTILGKWRVDSASWTYNDFNGIEKTRTNYYWGGTIESFNYWEFKNDGGVYTTMVDFFSGAETVDYSPGAWIVHDEKIKFTWQSNPSQVDEYAIKELNSDNLAIEYTNYSPNDTIVLGGSPAGIYKRYVKYFSR